MICGGTELMYVTLIAVASILSKYFETLYEEIWWVWMVQIATCIFPKMSWKLWLCRDSHQIVPTLLLFSSSSSRCFNVELPDRVGSIATSQPTKELLQLNIASIMQIIRHGFDYLESRSRHLKRKLPNVYLVITYIIAGQRKCIRLIKKVYENEAQWFSLKTIELRPRWQSHNCPLFQRHWATVNCLDNEVRREANMTMEC